ncbi:uncharacterized protein LOC120073578 [Benincasa hispida]|uniref:uncharacterized protein LOC120073578 n=1 Tax=Benincasa hispida TaxID=102211 RepID=UPI00190285F6|nr:uncharacterized protein LOC120073578 [Benincasa hispida]
MDPVPKNTKFHFTHPNHPLIYLSDDQDYLCSGCKTFGSDSRYRCHGCDFNLHEYCANCPEKLSSFLHQHPLNLKFLITKPQIGALGHQFCDICLDPVDGLVYRCKDCDFDAHPLCTQLPQEISHVIGGSHSLNLQKLPFGSCVICGMDCSSLWVYGCKVCGLYVHFDCLLEPSEESPILPRSRTAPRGISFAPPPPPPRPVPYGFTVYPGYPSGYHREYLYNNYVNNPQPSLYGYAPPPPPPPSSSRGRKLKKSMFYLVGRLAMNVVTSTVFGSPLSF